MKKILFSFIAILFSIACYSDTTYVPPGPISGTWTVGGSPYLIMGETTVVDGTTLTIAAGVLVEWQGSFAMWVEGQILASGTEGDSILFTAADPSTGWKGVRFDSTLVTNDSSIFKYCVFEYGQANGPYPDNHGGAIAVFAFGKVRIDHCAFRNNKSNDNSIDPNPTGGAIIIYNSNPLILNSSFKNNESAAGAAISCAFEAHPRIQNNEFADNTAISYSYWGTGYGGAIGIYLYSDPDIINNTFHGNYAPTGGGAISVVDKCDPLIKHNLIYNNTSGWIGGGIEIQDTCSPYLINNTIVDNHASEGGGIDLWGPNTPEIWNTILWGNTASTAGNQVNIMDDAVPVFYYCDIQGGQAAFGGFPHTGVYKHCIDSIPMFEDPLAGNYHLTWINCPAADTTKSPCIDTGDPTMFDPDGTICDMGALFFDQTGIGIPQFQPDAVSNRIYCYPNPAQKISEIRYQISEIRNVKLAVYDINGRNVNQLVNETQTPGEYTVRFDASDLPDGMYIIRLEAGSESGVGKLIVVH